jgi:hypothetical protein
MASEKDALNAFIADASRSILVRLGKNAITFPRLEIDLTNFEECTFPGYAAVAIPVDAWVMTDDSEDDLAQIVAKVHFESTLPVTDPERVTCAVVQQVYAGGPTALRVCYFDPTYIIDGVQMLDFDVRILSADLP